MTTFAILTAAALVVISAIHMVWAMGFTWPFGDEARLARAIRRAPDPVALQPAPVLAFLSGVLLFAAALAIWLVGPHGSVLEALGWLAAALFLLRAVAAFFGAGGGPEFRRYDRKVFGPVALALSVAFALLTGAA